MPKLIYDSVTDSAARLPKAIGLTLVITNDKDITTLPHTLQTMGCCSSVRTTMINWFYILNDSNDISLVERWINEISPVFPTLEIKIIDVPTKLLNKPNAISTVNLPILDENGNLIFARLPFSEWTNTQYGITKKSNYLFGRFHNIHCLIALFISYLSSNLYDIFTKDNASLVISEFFSSYKENIKTILQDENNYVSTSIDGFNNTFYDISTRSIDVNNEETWLALKEYVNKIVSTNLKIFRKYRKTIEKDETVKCIQAFYYKRNYKVEPYLAHILIRAGIINAGLDFVRQYFYIKEQTPDLYFWNRIFLTQFGFNYYYYFWLTKQRTFRFTDKVEFERKAHNYTGDSANEFFETFYQPYTTVMLDKLKDLYLKENFSELISIFSQSKVVIVKLEYKEKFINLKLSNMYLVSGSDDNYYHIVGDDYKLRKYKKNRFNEYKA